MVRSSVPGADWPSNQHQASRAWAHNTPSLGEPASLTARPAQRWAGRARIKSPAFKARYIRLTATRLAVRNKDYILAISELELLDADGKNIARGAAVQALDSIEAPDRWGRANLTDGIYPQVKDEAAAVASLAVAGRLQQIRARIHTPERREQMAQLAMQLASVQKDLAALPAGRMVYAAATSFKVQGGFQPTNGRRHSTLPQSCDVRRFP